MKVCRVDPAAVNGIDPRILEREFMAKVGEHPPHPKPSILSDFILGSQDGIVNVLGIILGLSAATRDVRIILVATFAALGAESIAMGAVAYTSTRARRRLYLSQMLQERREMKEVPAQEREEVRTILAGWGYKGSDLDEITERICRNPEAELEFMMSFELKMAPVESGAPRASAIIVGSSTVVGHFIPLAPFFLVGNDVFLGAVLAVVLSGITLFSIGWYEAKITLGSWWREGLEMLFIGLGGGAAGYLIGRVIGAA
jgi:VIT1/CCC1 family predicted Fe2+/Mn2+ transporter